MDQITIPEYNLLMEGVRLKQVDEDYRNHLQAYLNFAVQASKGKGKPVYRKFSKFYDYEKELKKAKNKGKSGGGEKSRFEGIGKLLNKKGEQQNGG